MSIDEADIRRAYEQFNDRGLAATPDFWHPDIVYHEAPDFPGGGTYRGIEAVRRRFEEYLEVLGSARAEGGRVEIRGDRAAWTVRFHGHTAAGLPHDHTWGYLGRFEDGLVIECRAFYEPDAAFEALGAAD